MAAHIRVLEVDLRQVPTQPGVYRFSDANGRVIYVGKAKNLRSRLSSYFQDISKLHPRTAQMVATARDLTWTIVGNEVEALSLEYTWIKEYDPRFNVLYRDDKSYPYLAITMKEEIPRVYVTRAARKPGIKYFGPYTHVWALRETLDTLLRVFPVRTCTTGVLRRAQRADRPCLLGYIDKCSAPCVGKISTADHRELVREFSDFMAGNTKKFINRITQEMNRAAENQEYELAARLRDDLAALRQGTEKNTVVLDDNVNVDIFAMDGDELEAAVQVFFIRGGRIRGQRGWVVEKAADQADAELVESLLQQVYGESMRLGQSEDIPPQVIVPTLPDNVEQLQAWLGESRGSRVRINLATRGPKKSLQQTVKENAKQAFVVHRTKRAGDLTLRSAALTQLHEELELPSAPLRIECYDISHTSGSHQAASMVVFEDGLPRKKDYRSFTIRSDEEHPVPDDTAAMAQVITRRFSRYLHEQTKPNPDERAPSFSYPPQLVVVDGGLPQVNAAAKALAELELDIPVIGLAKRLEEVWLPQSDFPFILRRSSPGLYLLQQIRDEAHRFAIKAHRSKRSRAMTVSRLDEVAGLGKARQRDLLQVFGSVKGIKAATVDQLQQVPGIGKKMAEKIFAEFHSDEDRPARG